MIQEFEAIAQKIQSDFERTKRIPHQGTKGDAREMFVTKHFLNEYLPKKYSIGSGLITDSIGKFSKQQDLVVYDGFNLPVLQDLQDNKIFFAEQVFAAIEVKSTLNTNELVDILTKAESVSALQRLSTFRLALSRNPIDALLSSNIFFFGFVYESKLSLAGIRDFVQKRIKETEKQWNISSIIVLSDSNGDTGLITNTHPTEINSLKVIPSLDSPIASVQYKSQGEALFGFYLSLMQALQIAETNSSAPDYLAYAKAAGIGTVNIQIGQTGIEILPHHQAIETLRRAHLLPDKPILDAYSFLVLQVMNSGMPDNPFRKENAFFRLGENTLIRDPKPKDMWIAINRYVGNALRSEDRHRLEQLVRLLRIVSKEDTHLDVIEVEDSIRNEIESSQFDQM